MTRDAILSPVALPEVAEHRHGLLQRRRRLALIGPVPAVLRGGEGLQPDGRFALRKVGYGLPLGPPEDMPERQPLRRQRYTGTTASSSSSNGPPQRWQRSRVMGGALEALDRPRGPAWAVSWAVSAEHGGRRPSVRTGARGP